MKIIAILLALTPSFIHKNIRRMMGASIGKGSRIRFGTILMSRKITIGKKTKIGPFSYVSAQELTIGNYSKIKILSAVSSRVITVGNYVHISPLAIISGEHTENSIFKVGDHSRFFPFCWIETGEGVTIGNNVGVGGHTLIFTHGVWSDYLDGGPVAFGPVTIKDNVWLPWRVFVMPNVTIGENAIIGANSTVTRSVADNVIAAGSPAKELSKNALQELSNEEKQERIQHILSSFSKEYNFKTGKQLQLSDNTLIGDNCKIIIDDHERAANGDLVFLLNKKLSNPEIEKMTAKRISIINHQDKTISIRARSDVYAQFVSFLRKYGIRLSTIE
ncbi:MAG: hypothetical protein QNK23_04775 [Crocinitomicaceae bacterium]|nr:hypothetical protein [Crocinitomicaceae bacterium]